MIDLLNLPFFVVLIVLLFGISFLFFGSESLVRGASRTARRLGVNPIVVGLTVVAFATSMPELLVSLLSALKGSADISVGNIVGSNLANIGLVLGFAVVLRPITVQSRILKFELPVLLIISLFFWLFSINKIISRIEGFLFLFFLLSYLYYITKQASREAKKIREEYNGFISVEGTFLGDFVLIIVGGALLFLGAEFTVNSAVEISRRAGISQVFIGLSLVAVGTSLPEFAVSLIASIKKEGDISIGNVIGSNLMNTLGIIGVVSFAKPLSINPELIKVQIPLMILLTFLLFPFMLMGKRLGRLEGMVLILIYVAIMFHSFPR